jgi:hypothetical protein
VNPRITTQLSRHGAGRSPCCNAKLDESEVVRDGPHAGSGPRYCAKCTKLVMYVLSDAEAAEVMRLLRRRKAN